MREARCRTRARARSHRADVEYRAAAQRDVADSTCVADGHDDAVALLHTPCATSDAHAKVLMRKPIARATSDKHTRCARRRIRSCRAHRLHVGQRTVVKRDLDVATDNGHDARALRESDDNDHRTSLRDRTVAAWVMGLLPTHQPMEGARQPAVLARTHVRRGLMWRAEAQHMAHPARLGAPLQTPWRWY